MALGLLWLGLTLLGALQTQAKDSFLKLILSPSLSTVPLQPHFRDDQGKWYAIGVAESTIQNGTESQLEMYSTTFELNDDHSYNVTSIMPKEDTCDLWIRTLSPSVRPGQFTLSNMQDYPEIRNYTVKVVATNYKQFGVVFLKMVLTNSVHIEITLYGRAKELSPELKEHFVKFSKSVGLTDDNIIFTDPIEKCIDE
ncbi:Neutrophil gelatinase-associated lipocalin [Heterocephalus glaber]|uniref:Neutrophil gelatinase-associated lipocalin n=1 Tax=Heterocephalus glaber TaxID=10181 RepID=G5AMW7_HETGA|nr:Neutrophil gelatinase-associated lipocalin [Heterocephalus glaber]